MRYNLDGGPKHSMNTKPKCPKCGGEMKEGFVVDKGYAQRSFARWVAGPPEETLFGFPKIDGKETRSIRTFCCQSCRFLESYADRL